MLRNGVAGPPKNPPKPPRRFDSERPTGIICAACGGDYKIEFETGTTHRETYCRWCKEGVMSPIQLKAWKATRR
jgi:hypothetical protein